MATQRPSRIIYNNGFKIKLENRRVLAVKQEDGSWRLYITRLWKEPLKKGDKKHFTIISTRGSLTITRKIINLSDEALASIAQTYFDFECKNNPTIYIKGQ